MVAKYPDSLNERDAARWTLAQHAAIVLADEVSQWTLNNRECYPRVRLWQRAVDELGLDRDYIEARVDCEHNKTFNVARRLVCEQLGKLGVEVTHV